MANVTLRLVKGTPLTNSEVDNNFSNLNITKTEIGGDLGGNVFTPRVSGIQGRAVSNAAPSNAQVLTWSVTSNTWLPSNAVALYSELQTKPGLNVIISGDVVGNANIVLANTNTNIITINTVFSPTSFDSRYLRLSTTGLQVVTGPVEFESNVIFSGNVTTISANNLIIEDNFIYLNNQAINANIDFGFVGNYNDGTYAHAGFFRDASDNGTWKLFDGYKPEPDANINIDTSNSTFRFANLQINTIRANTLVGISNTTVVTNLNADLLDGQQGTYYSDYTNATNRPAANVLLTGDVSGSSNVSLVAGTNIVTISTTIQANSVALGTDTVGPYVGNVVTGGNVTVSVSGEEGANVTISIPQAIGSNANVTFNNVTGSNAIFSPAIYGTAVYSGGSPVWTAANDGAGSGLDADTLDGLNSNYFTNYVNQNNKPSANVVISGAISGSANTLLSANTNIISISTSVNNNSVTLGTHTVGDYTARVIAGTAINVSGTGDEGNVITVTHADTSTLLGLIGTQGIANITVDTFGHVTAANTATYLTAESDTLATVTGRGATTTTAITVNTSAGANAITTTGNISVNGALVFTQNTDGAGSGLDADLLDGQQGTYYLDYNNLTNDPAANIVLTGNLLGSGNAVLGANTNIITVSARVADNSVTLGTHTVGRFIANVQQGTGIEVSGGGAEDAVATVSHADTSTLSGLQGGAGIASITVDGFGHVTAVGSATYLTTPGLNVAFTGDVTGTGNINLTNSSTNSLTIALTVQPNSVALGTDTTGNYTDRVVGGTGISVTGTADEGNVLTASLTTTGVSASTYGNATIVPVFTVDAQGRLTSASNVTIPRGVANILLTGDVSGSANAVLNYDSTTISISTTVQPNSVALGTDTTGNYVDRVVGGNGISIVGTVDEGNVLTANLTATGVVASTYGNATIVPVITIDAQGRITSASNVTISGVGGGGGGPSTDTLANVTARGNVTGDTITITNAGNSLVASGNIQTVGNVVITTGNLFAHRFVDIGNVSYFVEPVASNSVIVAGNVYTNQRIGFMNVNTTVSVVYQYYNANARSIDTVFG